MTRHDPFDEDDDEGDASSRAATAHDERALALIERDAYDEAAFARLLEQSPQLQAVIEGGTRLLPRFAALVHDIFSILFKYSVVRRSDVPPSATFADRALDWIVTSGGFERLKAETTLDEVRAGFACTRLSRGVLALLRDPTLFSGDELLEAFQAEQLEQELEQKRAELDSVDEFRDLRQQRQQEEEQGDADPATTPAPGEASSPSSSPAAPPGQGARGAGSLEQVARTMQREIAELERGLASLRKAQLRRLEQLPASTEGTVRGAVDVLPERMHTDESAAEAFTQAVGGVGESLTAQARLELGERLLDNDKLKRLARLVGAFRQVALGVRRRRFERRPAEVHEIERSGELARVLPSELVQLRHPLLRLEFGRRLVESELMAYAVEGRERAGRGPVVVLLDGSGSMQGPRELWAKAVSLTLLELCRRQRRAFHALVFSASKQATRRFQLTGEQRARSLGPPPIDYPSLVDFAEYFPRGGTRFEHPVEEAVRVLGHETRFKRGDIVLITDGEAHLSDDWLAWFERERQRLGFKLHAVLVDVAGAGQRATLERLADSVASVTELTAESARSLYEAL